MIVLGLILTTLIMEMESRDYRRRIRAHNALSELMPMTLTIPFPSGVESRYRLNQIKSTWYRDNGEQLANKIPWITLPWIWSNGYTGVSVNYYYYRVPGHIDNAGTYERWRYATHLWLIDQIKNARSWKSITEDLRVMRNAETDWKKEHE